MDWLQRIARGFLLGAIVLFCFPTSAEIYRWVDASGKLHFTQNLGQVPALYRATAKARAEAPKGPTPIQHYTPPKPPARIDGTRRSKRSKQAGKTHRIRVERAGSSMRVMVRLNDELDVPFILDTGATYVTVPSWAVKELGLAVDGPGVRTIPMTTANGVRYAPVVTLDSVRLGTAVVNNVAGTANDTMSVGLLGLSFFNHFSYNIDAARGLVTLTENSLAEDGALRGGRSRGQWRDQFRGAQFQIESAKSILDDLPPGRTQKRTRVGNFLAKAVENLELLEREADEARVPFTWRD